MDQQPLHGIGATLEFFFPLHLFWWDPWQSITGSTLPRLIMGRITIVVRLGIGSPDTGKADGLPMDGNACGFLVTGNTILDDR